MLNFNFDSKSTKILLLILLIVLSALGVDFALDGTLDTFNYVNDAIDSVE